MFRSQHRHIQAVCRVATPGPLPAGAMLSSRQRLSSLCQKLYFNDSCNCRMVFALVMMPNVDGLKVVGGRRVVVRFIKRIKSLEAHVQLVLAGSLTFRDSAAFTVHAPIPYSAFRP